MIDPAQIAELLDETVTPEFEHAVQTAVAELERQLGYPLCGTIEAEERIFVYRDALWHKVHPMYDVPSAVSIVHGNGDEETLGDFMVGQNGKLTGTWFNGIKLCNRCLAGRCYCNADCSYLKVTAKWGLVAPEAGDDTACRLPADLLNVIGKAVEQASDPGRNIQSEGTGTRNYSKFTKSYEDAYVTYSSVIETYKLREPRI